MKTIYIQLEPEELEKLLEKAALKGAELYRKEQMKNEYLTTGQVAKEINVNITTVVRWINSGKLKATKVNRDSRISRFDLEKFKENYNTK